MNKERVKSLILTVLIMLCIWQTGKLWLGDMPSLNFFVKKVNTPLKQIEPISVWLNPGGSVPHVYRLDEGNREYQSITTDMGKNIRTYMKEGKVVATTDLDWNNILTQQGILYEYPLSLTYGEIIGSGETGVLSGLPQGEKFDYLFLYLGDETRDVTNWHMVSLEENKVYSVEILGQFENIEAFKNLLKEESLVSKIRYQPTYNMGGISTKNIFLPLTSKEISMPYEVLEYYNPLKEYKSDDEFSRFNPYINHFFLNPLLKKEEKTEDGIYVFSELMRAVVTYYPWGVFEYSNVGVTASKDKPSRLAAYNVAKDFINKSESIPKDTRKNLFLANIERLDTGYKFCFDTKVEGIPVYLSQEVREYLGMEYAIEITVQGQRVSNFKWNVWVLRPKKISGHNVAGSFDMKYTEALNKVLEYVADQGDTETLAVDDMKWVYMVKKSSEDVELKWIVRHDNKWYSP